MKQSISAAGGKCSLSTRLRSAFGRVDWSEVFELLPIVLLFVVVFGGISFAMFGSGNWLLGWFCGIVGFIMYALLVCVEFDCIIKNK